MYGDWPILGDGNCSRVKTEKKYEFRVSALSLSEMMTVLLDFKGEGGRIPIQ